MQVKGSSKQRYILQEEVGSGGMGVVYKALDRFAGKQVAYKQVTIITEKIAFMSKSNFTDSQLALGREFTTLASLQHPNIISVLDYGFNEKNQPYFTMEYLEDATTIIETGKGKPIIEKTSLIIQMLQALIYLHRHDILHCDIKPNNVLVYNNRVRLLDFGLSIETSKEKASMEKSSGGTIAYMAPEQLGGYPPSRASDLYSIGLVCYEMFAGEYPYDTSNIYSLTYQILNEPVNVDNIELPEPLLRWLKKMISPIASERYTDAWKAMRDLCNSTGQSLPEETTEIRESLLQRAKFIGRDEELNKLTGLMEEAIKGTGSAVLIGGESGVGKSRLIDELKILAVVKGMITIRGQSHTEGSPYHLWQEILNQFLLYCDTDPEDEKYLKIIVPNIDSLVQHGVPDPPPLDPQQLKIKLYDAVSHLFTEQKKPVMMILEDLHWSGSESIALLAYIIPLIQNKSIMIIGNYRDDEKPDLPSSFPGISTIKLKRLSEENIYELSTSILGSAGTQPSIIQFLNRETEGNAFFLVEVLRTLAEQTGHLEDIAQMSLPHKIVAGGIREIVRKRLDRIPEDVKEILKLAAVAGRRLDLELLRNLFEMKSLEKFLEVGADAVVLEFSYGNWFFAHDKLREGVLGELSKDEWPSLHRKVAETIESIHTDLTGHVSILAHLWEEAGDKKHELPYTLSAGKQGLAISASAEAVGYLQRAINILQQDIDFTDRDLLELEAQSLLGYGLMNMRGYGDVEVENAYQRASELSAKVDESPEMGPILYGLFSFYASRGEYESAESIAKRLIILAQRYDDPIIRLVGENALGLKLILEGNISEGITHTAHSYQSADTNERAAHLVEYGGDFRAYPRTWSAIAQCLIGQPDKAQTTYEEALFITREHPYTHGFVLCFCPVPQFRRDYAEMRKRADELISIAQKHGFIMLNVIGNLHRAWVNAIEHQSPESIEIIDQGLGLLQMVKLDSFLPMYLGLKAEALAVLHRVDEALTVVEEGLNMSYAAKGNFFEPELHRLKALFMKMSFASTDEIERSLRKSIELARKQQALWWQLRSTADLCELLNQKEKADDNNKMLIEIREKLTEGSNTLDFKRVNEILEKS